jgi:hypothetical protein
MSLTDVAARERAQEVRALRARIGLGVKMLTTAGYAMIGGTFFKAVMDQRAIPPTSYLRAGAGLAALGFALLFAPQGSRSDD